MINYLNGLKFLRKIRIIFYLKSSDISNR